MRRIIASLLIFAGAACGVTEPDEIALRLEGTVTTQASGQPIAGARIVLFEDAVFGGNYAELATTVTDSQGRYSLTRSFASSCPRPFFSLGVSASASAFKAKLAAVPECNGTLQRFDFVLEAS